MTGYIQLYSGVQVNEQELSEFATNFIANAGVIKQSGALGFAAAELSPLSGLKVNITTAGAAYVDNSSFAAYGTNPKYWLTRFTGTLPHLLTFAANSSGSTRIDLICIKVDTTVVNGNADNSGVVSLVVVQGTPGTGVPATPADHYKLYEVTIANGATNIVNANITDKRAEVLLSLTQTLSGTQIGSSNTIVDNNVNNTQSKTLLSASNPIVDVASSFDDLMRNAIINGGCIVNQRITAPNISSSYQYGAVDRIAGAATGTAVSAGTIAQTAAANAGSTNYALKLAGVTLTGSGVVYARYRMEARDAINFKNLVASFALSVYHDVGSSKNYTITINKANSADNFGAVTNIATSSALPVNNTTKTTIKLENISMGDCSNGIEIIVQCACGAITTKNFEFADWQFNKGAVALPFFARPFATELQNCKRYWCKSYQNQDAPGATNNAGIVLGQSSAAVPVFGGRVLDKPITFGVTMRITPTVRFYSPATGASGKGRDLTTGADFTIAGGAYVGAGSCMIDTSSQAQGDFITVHWTADAEL